MYYIVYKTTNLINGKIYIGQHQTSDLNDGYLGSGKHLKRAIDKYGIENFQREVLYQFDNLEDMTSKEAELVTEEFCKRDDTYNICPGGKGGFGYINSRIDYDTRVKRGKTGNKVSRQNTFLVEYHIDRFKNMLKDRHKNGTVRYDNFKGKNHSEETIKMMKLSHKGKHQGSKNSQFGSMWITNGTENSKIKKLDEIPNGWYKGRIIIFAVEANLVEASV